MGFIPQTGGDNNFYQKAKGEYLPSVRKRPGKGRKRQELSLTNITDSLAGVLRHQQHN